MALNAYPPAKNWSSVHVRDVDELGFSVLIAKQAENDVSTVSVCFVHRRFRIRFKLSRLFNTLSAHSLFPTANEAQPSVSFIEPSENKIPRVTLAIVSPDSTVVYYKVHKGIARLKEASVDTEDGT
ncbi:hypothetical protein BC938DRAFT_480053 [Jimgerdemannia flammicorona]|uniref:tRNA-splicing endonuclease subunit Sen15 domain-containing protein n=1 Tax=Jimgerdemannia flammicorona TaxID=994334 RepID=A0A433QJI7_9FUNG|nr:hypothetical protein BC938DRAFT_480053 [Jimgerdemannia flammicorona]